MPDMDGFELQKQIDQEFELPVVFMSADDQDLVMIKGLQNGALFFLPKPVSPNDLKHLWQYAFANKKGKMNLEKIEALRPGKLCNENTLILETISPIANDISNEANERKIKASMREEINDAYATPQKKGKFVWTSSLHNQFLEAIRRLGVEKAVPKKILEIMNVPGLTREHIASHLQKYRLFVKKVSETRSGIQFHRLQSASALVLPSEFLSRKYSFGGSFPISRFPNLGPSSSFNQRRPFSTNVTPGFGNDISTLLYNGINSKQPIIERSKSFPDTNNLVYVNKSTFPLYGNFSKGVAIGQEKPQMAQKGIDNGLNIDMPGFGKIGAFSHQKFDLDPNLNGFAKLGTFENKELEGPTNFVFENGLMNGMGNESMSTVPVFGGTCDDTLANLGVSSSSNENQTIFESTPQHQNVNSGGDNVRIFDWLDDLSDSGNNCFLQQFGDQGDASRAWMNQTNIQSETQQSAGGEELIPNFGISRSPSPDQIFQSIDQNSFLIDEEEFLRSLFSPGKNGGDRHSGTY